MDKKVSCSTVFLDRDGTVNVKAPEGHYITSPDELVLLPGAAQAVAQLNAAAVRVVLVTNQRWLNGLSDFVPYEAVHARLIRHLAAENAHLDASYFCPHAASSCSCRKPRPGMLTRAAREHGFSLTGAIMIGDQETDVIAGRAAGTATVRVCDDRTTTSSVADYLVPDLMTAVRLILGK